MNLFAVLVTVVLLRLLLGPRMGRSKLLSVGLLVLASVGVVWLADPAWRAATAVLSGAVAGDDSQESLEQGLREDDIELIRRSLAAGADAANSNGRESYLVLARSPEARQLLLDHGASPDGLPGQTLPLWQAWGDDDLALFQWLLAAGADPELAIKVRPDLLVITLFNQDDLEGWMQPLLDRGVDLNRPLSDGLSVVDALLLSGLHPDWVERLRNAGARHALLLDRGEPLPDEHPALTHVRLWLQAKLRPEWHDIADSFLLADALRQGCDHRQPVLADASLVGRVEGNQALVEVVGPTEYGPRRSMIGLRRMTAELDPAAPVERPEEPGASDGIWRISSCTEDRRFKG